MTSAMPRKTCDRMTPLLPRAPISAPVLAARATLARPESWAAAALASSMAAWRVASMFVPVSPSGTGKTLRESISWR